MELSIKGLVKKFLNEVNELKNEPLTKEQFDKLAREIDEIHTKMMSLEFKMRDILCYEEIRRRYTGAIDKINELIEDYSDDEIKI